MPADDFSSFLFEPKELVLFEHAWNWQKKTRAYLIKKNSASQAVWLLQHHPCYTIGRGGDGKFLLFDISDPPLPLYRVDRGGQVTHHLPGQIVVYLVLDLRRYKTDLHWYLRKLEQVLIDVLVELGLSGKRIKGLTGVWIENLKVGSIGVGCSRWITQHGFSLNINCDLIGFEEIVPCGLSDSQVGRLDQWVPGLSVEDVQPLIKRSLRKHFGFIWKNS